MNPYVVAGKTVIHIICIYELIALHSNLPTISYLHKTHKRDIKFWASAGPIYGWLIYHLFWEK